MIKKINLIMPMAGVGSRFSSDNFSVPKPLIEIHGKPFFYWAVQSIKKFVSINSLTFILLKPHVEEFNIDKKILSYFQDAKFKIIPKILNGPVLTCLGGIENIPENEPIIFNDCDHIFYCKQFYEFLDNKCSLEPDGGLLTFESNDSKFSFAEFDKSGNLIKTAEKIVISNNAICGAYYFKNKEIFESSAKEYLNSCENKEYFLSGVYNIMSKHNKSIKNFKVDYHLSFGTENEYKSALNSKRFDDLC